VIVDEGKELDEDQSRQVKPATWRAIRHVERRRRHDVKALSLE